MKITLSGPRSMAISVVAGLAGWLISANDTADVAKYQKMSKDALLTELTSRHISIAGAMTFCLIITLGIVVAVDVLTDFFDAVWRRVSLPQDRSVPPSA